MMVHHDSHHRPFTSPSSKSGVGAGAAAAVPESHLPPLHSIISSSSSPSSSSGMGYPFTQAQWRELERQAMIYKYMVASLPVPPDLLFPLPSSLPPNSHYSFGGGSYNLRFGNSNGDPEPGRCRRTDGKKWRCSRDAAPDQKYCERHLNRGRPRSRKPVEVSASVSPNKKTRHSSGGSNAPLPSTSSAAAAFNGATESRTQAPPMYFHGNGGYEPVALDHNKETRGLDWLMIGDSAVAEETLSLNSNYNTSKPNQFNEYLFPLSSSDVTSLAEQQSYTPRGFIDAWSDSSSKQSCSPHDHKLSLAEEMGHIHMGLGVTHWARTGDSRPGSWMSSAPGGPLGEVFRPASNPVSRPSSPNSGSPLVSSPSGVLQRKMASMSDSSGGSSPTLGNSMGGRSEITVQWFSPN